MEVLVLGIATNLVSTLMVAGSERLRTAALGNDQEQALEEAFTGATAVMLVEVARRANYERELRHFLPNDGRAPSELYRTYYSRCAPTYKGSGS